MKFINIILSISISTLAYGQNKNLLTKLKPIEADFIYKINDSLEFKGTRIICTLPVRTFFTDIIYNESTNILSVAGYFTLGGEISDTTRFGLSGASIFLLNFDEKGKIKSLFDFGETSDIYHPNTKTSYAGHFSRMFTLTKGDVLLIGGPGIFGATAFKVGELLNIKN